MIGILEAIQQAEKDNKNINAIEFRNHLSMIGCTKEMIDDCIELYDEEHYTGLIDYFKKKEPTRERAVVVCPLHMIIGKKKAAVNLNSYRNYNFGFNNLFKKSYSKYLSKQIVNLPTFNKITISIQIYFATSKEFDIGNIASITEKFFLDTLTKHKIIEDDNMKFVHNISSCFGGVDRSAPRAIVIIKECFDKDDINEYKKG